MHKSHAAETTYGTVGQATYSTDLKRWEFVRDPEHDCQELRALGIDCLAIKSSFSPSEGGANHVHESRQRKLLSARYPEATPAIPLLLKEVKNGAHYISEQGVSKFGNLISLGRAVDVDNRKTKSAYQIFAVPDGEHGKDLKLYLAHVEYYGWKRDKRSWLAIPRIQNSDPGWWHGTGGPIQQVCFAPSTAGQSTLLAIRSPASIFILKPLYRRTPVAQLKYLARDTSILESCIDANQLVSVVCDSEPHGVFAHISFNPWYKRQFAVIDSNGNWTIYEIKGKANSSKGYKALQIERKRLSNLGRRDDHSLLDSEDKRWAKIFWIKDVNLIVACNRLGLKIFDMKQRLVSTHDLNLRFGANDVILDVQQCSEINDLAIILTSSVISVVRIDRVVQPLKTSDPDRAEVHAEILHTWKHDRDYRDKSLQICYTIDKDCIEVVLYSQIKCLLTLHTFLIPQDKFSVPAAVFDPVELQYSPIMSKKAQNNIILNAMIAPLTRGYATQGFSVQSEEPANPNLNVRYYILVILWDDYSVTESVHYLTNKRDDTHIEKPLLVKRGPLSKTRVGSLDDVMAENEHNGQLINSIHSHECQLVTYKQNPSSRKIRKNAVPRTVNFGEILHYKSDICDSLDDLADIIRGFSDDNPYSDIAYSWLYQIGDKFKIHDIDEVSQILEDAVLQNRRKDKDGEVSTKILQIIPPYFNTFIGYDGVMRLSIVYEKIVAQWLAKLPNNVSSKVRMAKEKLARQIAAELCLASLILRSDGIRTDEDEQRMTENANLHSPAPKSVSPQIHYNERKQISDHMTKQSYQEPRSSTRERITTELPSLDNPVFPTPSTTPSVISSSSAYSAKSLHCTALNKYGYSPLTRTLPKALSRCLEIWNFGENPYSVDGEKAIQAVTTPGDADDENEYGMTASERRRLQRRAERLLKRQRRQAAKATETMTATDNLVSLQLRPANIVQSSQATGDVTMTPAATATGAGSSQAVPNMSSRFTLSSHMPSSSQKMEKVRSSGVQSAEGNAKKRRRVAGF